MRRFMAERRLHPQVAFKGSMSWTKLYKAPRRPRRCACYSMFSHIAPTYQPDLPGFIYTYTKWTF